MDRVAIFRISLTSDDYLPFYRGQIKEIQITSEDGQIIRFPASALRKYVSSDGIHGRFALHFDTNNKLTELRRVE